MARERYLAGVSEEELRPDEKIGAPKTLRGKWENYWYHHKFVTLIGAFIAVAAVVVIIQLINRPKYDYTLVLVTDAVVPSQTCTALGDKLAAYGEDLNGDGTVRVLVNAIALRPSQTSGDPYGGMQKLVATIGSGDMMFYAVEPASYEKSLKNILETEDAAGFFRPIETPDGTAERWSWKGSGIETDPDLAPWLNSEMMWFVRAPKGLASGNENQKTSDACKALLEAFIRGEKP